MKLYNIKISFNTARQSLKCFNLMFLNKGYLGKLTISNYEKAVFIEGLPFKHCANNLIKLIIKKKLIFKNITLTERNINKNIEVIDYAKNKTIEKGVKQK